jgi:hypothetical protein
LKVKSLPVQAPVAGPQTRCLVFFLLGVLGVLVVNLLAYLARSGPPPFSLR